MNEAKLSDRRKRLLLTLENMIGNQCYNAKIQNWGPNGLFEGEGREFRYPITFRIDQSQKTKSRRPAYDLPGNVVQTGYYAFGQNELHIMRALDKVLSFLETRYGLDVEKED